MNNYYVYFHFKKNTNIPFYVGKGCGKRAWSKNRNDKWKKITNKYNYDIELIDNNLTNEEVLISEIYWIAQLKNWGFNLSNMTAGGEGCIGRKQNFTKEWKEKLSKAAKNRNPMSEESRRKISEANKGSIPWNKGKKNVQQAWNKGISKYLTEEDRLNAKKENMKRFKLKRKYKKLNNLFKNNITINITQELCQL